MGTSSKRYGVPYKGSKNAIAEWIIENMPPGNRLVDIFAGGCAVTHCAMLSGKWDYFLANDIGNAPKLFFDAIHGKYANERRWISRDDFFRYKESDPYIKWLWSFGNDGESYMYAKSLIPLKEAAHRAIIGETLAERYAGHKAFTQELIKLCGGGKTMTRKASDICSQQRA